MSHISETIEKLDKELPPEVKLVAVSKFHPLSSIIEAYSAGQRVFAESRPQELFSKVSELGRMAASIGSTACPDICWHFIGHLQTNKLKMVLPYVSMVQSVDSVRLLEAIDRWAVENGRVIDVLLEYHVAQEQTKQGFTREEIIDIVSGGRSWPGIRLRGLMGMATCTEDETVIRGDFACIKALFDEISSGSCLPEGGLSHLEDFDQLSIGMTSDYRIAMEYGSTMVRIGTMIFGERQY